MQPITGPMAQALERNRGALNARFAAAQKGGGRVDGGAFLAHLAEVVEPIVRGVAGEFAEKVDGVTVALYQLSLELFAANLLGPGSCCPPVGEAWRRLLPKVPRLIAREPARVAAGVTNAVHNIAASPAARPGEWVDGMVGLAPHLADAAAMLECGKVLAWRAGMVRYREGALAAARGLEAGLAARALELPAGTGRAAIDGALERMAADPWVTPAEALAGRPNAQAIRIAARLGEFRGFGGPFVRPPTVRCVDGQFVVSDQEFSWVLTADVFGHAFQRTEIPRANAERGGRVIGAHDDGTVFWDKLTVKFDELAGFSGLAHDGRTVAVTLGTSHFVYLLARG